MHEAQIRSKQKSATSEQYDDIVGCYWRKHTWEADRLVLTSPSSLTKPVIVECSRVQTLARREAVDAERREIKAQADSELEFAPTEPDQPE